jgi:hypothetical protein
MIRTLVLALVLAALLVPSALAAAPKYKVGQKCSAKKQATYLKYHFTCVKGKLQTHK